MSSTALLLTTALITVTCSILAVKLGWITQPQKKASHDKVIWVATGITIGASVVSFAWRMTCQ